MRRPFLLALLIFAFCLAPQAKAAQDISPITTSPIFWTWNGTGNEGMKISTGDQRTNLGDCSATYEYNAGSAASPFDLNTAMMSAPLGTYTLELGSIFTNGGCSGYGIAPQDVYGIFNWTGNGFATSSTKTRIDAVEPYPNSTIGTSTSISLEAVGFINQADAAYDLIISWTFEGIANRCMDAICAANSTPVFSYQEPVNMAAIENESFDIATSAPPEKEGLYTMTTALQKPSTYFGFSGFFGLSFGYTTIVSMSTEFTIGTSTTLEQVLSGLAGAKQQALSQATSTQEALSSCLPLPGFFNVYDCVAVLFIPSATAGDISGLFAQIGKKPPFGYFSAVASLFGQATTSAASTTPQGLSVFAGFFEPLRLALVLVLWLALALWIFHRIRNFNFQS